MKTNEIDAASSSRSDMLRDVRENATTWGWYAGRYEEEFTSGPEATREAIIQVGRCDFDGEGFHIIEALKEPVDIAGFLDVHGLVERLIENVEDEHGNPDGFGLLFDPSFAQVASLDGMIKAEFRRWQELHGIEVLPWVFTRSRNAEFIEPSDQALERAGGGDA